MSISSTISTRPVVASDYAQWKILWDGYNAFYGRVGDTALSEQITQTTWSRIFDAQEPVHALVAESSAQLLGLTHYLYHRSTIALAAVCYLQDLYTLEAARGKGVGRALIDAVYFRAAEAGAPRVYWHTYATNATARRLYDRMAERPEIVMYRKAL